MTIRAGGRVALIAATGLLACVVGVSWTVAASSAAETKSESVGTSAKTKQVRYYKRPVHRKYVRTAPRNTEEQKPVRTEAAAGEFPSELSASVANANARISSQLPYMLAASRFAHYLKVIMRDKIGSFMTRENVSDYLNRWIANYVLLDDNASQSSKASYPLREARVDVFDIPGKPGAYKATVFLRPHFQLDELTASIRLVAELPPPAGA